MLLPRNFISKVSQWHSRHVHLCILGEFNVKDHLGVVFGNDRIL